MIKFIKYDSNAKYVLDCNIACTKREFLEGAF